MKTQLILHFIEKLNMNLKLVWQKRIEATIAKSQKNLFKKMKRPIEHHVEQHSEFLQVKLSVMYQQNVCIVE